MSNVEFNQNLVDTYFHDWVGISTYNTEDYKKGPSVFGLYFPDKNTAVSSYVFLTEWKNWKPDQPLILLVVKENDKKYNFYIYKENRTEYVKGTFEDNLNVKELREFLKNEIDRKFVVVARYPDSENNIVDNPSQDIILFENLRFFERSEIGESEIESN